MCVWMCVHGGGVSLNDQYKGWAHLAIKQTHTCVCVPFSSLLVCFMFPSTHMFTLSLYVPVPLVQLLNLHTCLLFFFSPPTLDHSCFSHMVYLLYFLVHLCPFFFASFLTHFTPPSICWSFVLRDRARWGLTLKQQKKSGLKFPCNVPDTGGPQEADEVRRR